MRDNPIHVIHAVTRFYKINNWFLQRWSDALDKSKLHLYGTIDPIKIASIIFATGIRGEELKKPQPIKFYDDRGTAAKWIELLTCIDELLGMIERAGLDTKPLIELRRNADPMLRDVPDAVFVVIEQLNLKAENQAPDDSLGSVEPSEELFIPSPIQKAILEKLDGRAMKSRQLAAALNIEQPHLYRGRGINQLKKMGAVKLDRTIGYFRPDHPPAS